MPTPSIAPTSNTTWICELAHMGLLVVKGPDAEKFLQGQVTCDIRELAGNNTRLGAQCNIKGRVLASFRALQMDQESIALLMPGNNIEITLKNLGKYIVFSKAKLFDYRTQFHIIGCYGSDSEKNLARIFSALPQTINSWIEDKGNYLVKLDEYRFECWIATENYTHVMTTLSADCATEAINAWQLLDIRAGTYWVNAESAEQFTPHELNYPFINAVNFRKGCYTGQEIVARMHYRGKLKRHTHRLLIDSAEALHIGSSLSIDDGAITLDILSCAINAMNQVECLAVCNSDQLMSLNSEKIKRLELPYAIPNAEDTTPAG